MRVTEERGGFAHQLLVRPLPCNGPDASAEQLLGIVEGLGLNVLRQAERDGAGFGRGRQDAQRLGQRRDELLGPIDPIPVFRDRLEAVVHRSVLRARSLELLQHGSRAARREDVSRQEQHGQSVDRRRPPRRSACSSRRVRWSSCRPSPGVDSPFSRSRSRYGPSPARSAAGSTRSRSFASRSACPTPATFPWPKIAKTPPKNGCSIPSRLGVLLRQELNERLRHRQASGMCHGDRLLRTL